MKKILFSLAFMMSALVAGAWGQKGHDVTVYIAEQHLTPKARAAVDSLLQGRSMVYWANWLDNASHTRDYAYTKTWHYKNIDEGERYEEAQANPAGDAVVAIKQQVEILSDPTTTIDQAQLSLKILLHIMGDLHQPMHLGHATDLGGNRTAVKFFNNSTNLHSLWDTSLVDSAHKWSYTEWSQQIDRPATYNYDEIVAGTVDDWACQTLDIATKVYRSFPKDYKASYNDIAYWTPTIEQQLLRGGLRLAHLLNQIFDPESASAAK
jgi:hypothetical protein